MRVYIAASKHAGDLARDLAALLSVEGHEVTSTWHADGGFAADPELEDERRRILGHNMSDLLRCEVLVALTHTGTPCATYSEIGVALGIGRPVVWIQGPAYEGGNIMDAHPSVYVNWTDEDDDPTDVGVVGALVEESLRAIGRRRWGR